MADLVIELVSEEIPARMQAGASRDLASLIELALTELGVWTDDSTINATCAPRHLFAYATDIRVSQPDQIIEKRSGDRGYRTTPCRIIPGRNGRSHLKVGYCIQGQGQ